MTLAIKKQKINSQTGDLEGLQDITISETSDKDVVSCFKIKAKVTINGQELTGLDGNTFIPITEFWSKINALQQRTLNVGGSFKIEQGQIMIDSNADNTYQGAEAVAGIIVQSAESEVTETN